jgi:hypothetical protein
LLQGDQYADVAEMGRDIGEHAAEQSGEQHRLSDAGQRERQGQVPETDVRPAVDDDGRGVTVSPTEHGRGNSALARHEWATAVGAAADHDTTHLDATLILLTAVKDGLARMRIQ